MVIGILCFPAGWDHEQVRGICGKESKDYFLGLCGIRWAFVMAFICVIDAFILSILAVVLSKRKVEPLPPHVSSNNIYKAYCMYHCLDNWMYVEVVAREYGPGSGVVSSQ